MRICLRLVPIIGWILVATTGCTSTSADDDSPGDTPTMLAIDCRDKANGSDPRCKDPRDVPLGSIGAGLVLLNDSITIHGGFLDAAHHRILLGADKTRQGLVWGMIFEVDLATGDRRIVTGEFDDPITGDVTVGTGPLFTQPYDVKPMPDGSWLVYADNGFFRVDPATGTRTMLFTHRTPNFCSFGGYGWHLSNDVGGDPSIAVVTENEIYVPVPGPISDTETIEAQGLARIATDGTCKIVTMSAPARLDLRLGTGPQSMYSYDGLAMVGPTLYALEQTTGRLLAIDGATGSRRLVASSLTDSSVGMGPSPQYIYLYPASADTLWTTGKSHDHNVRPLVTIDLATGDRTEYEQNTDGPLGHFDEDNWAAPYPSLPGVAVMVRGASDHAIVLFELATGNNMTLSR